MEYNLTYNDTIKRYTINIPLELFEKVKIKSKKAGVYRVSIYIRALLEREMRNESPLTMDDILNAQKESRRIASAEHRREDLEYLQKGWLQRNIDKLFDKTKRKEYHHY